MVEIAFTIPTNRMELLSEIHSNYTVKNVIVPAEIAEKLDEAQICLREEGPNFIIDNFDTYYSVVHYADKLRSDLIFKAYKHLLKATEELNNSIQFVLEDKESLNDEIKSKMVTVLKMLVYMFIQFLTALEEKKKKTHVDLLGKNKNKDKRADNFEVDKSKALDVLNTILQREINLFWEPPIVEHDFVGMVGEFCFTLLQNPSIKQEKNVIMEIFGVFGNLVKSFDYGKNFVSRLIQSIRMYEHVVHCVTDGIKMVIQQFNAQSLVHHFVKEATEWQVDEAYQDGQGTRCCSIFLTEMAIAIPDLILPEVMYLNKYLAHDSHSLRLAVLNVISEIILNVLTHHDLSEDEKDLRDEFLQVVIEHICDFHAAVRTKVIQNLSKLQAENAIPLAYQNQVLSEVIKHLKDKAANVRKSAIHCVTTFLEHNPFGANLQLKTAKQQLEEKKELLNKMESTYREMKIAKIRELEAEWASFQKDLREEIESFLDHSSETEDDEEEAAEAPDRAVEEIRALLYKKNYREALKICQRLKNNTEAFKNLRKENEDHEVHMYLSIFQSIFVNTVQIVDELRTGAGMTEEDIRKIQALESIIKYFENTTAFLEVVESAIEPMKLLLFSQTVGDMHEAIKFFVSAYKFQIDHATDGILEMLKIMRCNEQDRQAAVVDAFKTIYLVTDTDSMAEHTKTILKRLLALLKELTYDNLSDFESIVSEWTSKGILDNSVIDRCWQFYTQREPVTDDDARAAAEILRMTATGRVTIITKNISVVTKMIFSDEHKNDMMYLASSCRLLAVAGSEKVDMNSEDPPFRLNHMEPIFQNLSSLLIQGFFQKHPYYTEAVQAAIDFIFRVSSKPMAVVEKIIKEIDHQLKQSEKKVFFIIRLCHLLGCTAVNMVGYLDNGVYRELKRRNNLREERKKDKKNKKGKQPKKKANGSSLNGSVLSESGNETTLLGAEAEDPDSEYVLAVIENDVVSPKGVLGQYAPFILNICQRPDIYSNILLQQHAVTALMRYMLVSSKFCRDNIRLLFTILERTTYPQLKCTILIHCADLLTRFPNIVEPWNPRLYNMLKDALVEVRKKAFFALANLILRSMIRAHSHISELAVCLIDQDAEVSSMCKSFFERIAQKDNNIVNVTPDIFTHLVRSEEIGQEELRYILKFLFGLMDDNSKRIENLVDRMCHKYTPDDNMRLNRNVTFCLSLVNYNDKALRKLREKFPMYQHHLHDVEIYSIFKQILTECNKVKPGKADLRPIVTEIETCIASIFEINENGQTPRPPPPIQKVTRKGRKGKPKKKSSRRQTSESESEQDEEPVSKAKKSARTRSTRSSRSSTE